MRWVIGWLARNISLHPNFCLGAAFDQLDGKRDTLLYRTAAEQIPLGLKHVRIIGGDFEGEKADEGLTD